MRRVPTYLVGIRRIGILSVVVQLYRQLSYKYIVSRRISILLVEHRPYALFSGGYAYLQRDVEV